MSGEKDARVETIDVDRMRRAAEQVAERERQRQRTAAACAAASAELEAARGRLREVERERAAVAAQHAQVQAGLREINIERGKLTRRISEVKEETIRARQNAMDLQEKISSDQKSVAHDLDVLATKERELLNEMNMLESRIAAYDGRDIVEARGAAEEAAQRQERLNADLAKINAEIAAYSNSPALGFVLEQMVSSFSEFAFHVDRALVNDSDIEIYMSRHGEETVRIATAMIDAKLAAAAADPRLRLLIERTEPNLAACIADTTKIMQRLREKGVVVSLDVRGPDAQRPAKKERTAVHEKAGEENR